MPAAAERKVEVIFITYCDQLCLLFAVGERRRRVAAVSAAGSLLLPLRPSWAAGRPVFVI